MKKRIGAFIFTLLLSITMAASLAFADTSDKKIPDTRQKPRLVDDAKLLDDAQRASITSKLDEISERQKMDVAIVTVNSLEGKSVQDYADDFYDYNGYGFGKDKDGMLLLIDMDTRKWHITTTGGAIKAITDAGIDYISEKFLPYLSEGNYESAFEAYANTSDKLINQAKEGKPYDVGDELDEEQKPLTSKAIWIALGLGFLIAKLICGRYKAQLKTVRENESAGDYVKHGSMNITEQKDTFVYRNVERVAKPKDDDVGGGSSTHESDSGTTHGGDGGSF